MIKAKSSSSFKEQQGIQFDYIIENFNLFQTSAWDIFSSKLKMEKVEVLYELGSVCHRFEVFNAAMKLESTSGELSSLLREEPKFIEDLNTDLEALITILNLILQ